MLQLVEAARQLACSVRYEHCWVEGVPGRSLEEGDRLLKVFRARVCNEAARAEELLQAWDDPETNLRGGGGVRHHLLAD